MYNLIQAMASATQISPKTLNKAFEPFLKDQKLTHRIIRRLNHHQIAAMEGLSEAQKAKIGHAIEMARLMYTSPPNLGEVLDTPDQVWPIAQDLIGHETNEHALVLALDNRHQLIGHRVISIGASDECIIRAKEVFEYLTSVYARAFFIAHNHPSGDNQPSKDDIQLTEDFFKASKIMGLRFLDHLIVTDHNYQSIRDYLGYWNG